MNKPHKPYEIKAKAWDTLYNESAEPTDSSEEWKQEDWELAERMEQILKRISRRAEP